MDSLLNGAQGNILKYSLSNAWGCLAQSNDNRIKVVGSIVFTRNHELHKDNKVAHSNFVFDYRLLKED